MKYLIINSGSSSIKYQLFEMNGCTVMASGLIEKIGEADGHAEIRYCDSSKTIKRNRQIQDHKKAFEEMEALLYESGTLKKFDALGAIGHRVVHGGEKFKEPVVIDDAVIEEIERLIPLAPLHNPANLEGIKTAIEHYPSVPNVAVFDTAFHHSLPEHAYLYALPYELYEKHGIRRYGFHGTSHGYVAKKAAEHLGFLQEALNIITLHLGNGASAAAIKNGRSIETSMGMTPLEGLVMGTRSGDIDAGILFYLARNLGLDIDGLDALLNKKSGLKGICGNNDIREISESAKENGERSNLALDMFVHRLKKYIGAYMAVLGRVDVIVFTGGIGENSKEIREMTCSGLEGFGILLDNEKNSIPSGEINEISSSKSKIKLLTIHTNEELEIALQAKSLLITRRQG